jgi:prevent-host-death family protein
LRGKSDPIDAAAVALAAIRAGLDTLPVARLEGVDLELRRLLDRCEDLVAERTREINRLRWALHDMHCPIDVPARAMDRIGWSTKLMAWTYRQSSLQGRIAHDTLLRIRALTRDINAYERELDALARRGAQTGRGQDPPRSAALPQAPHHPPRLHAPHAHPQHERERASNGARVDIGATDGPCDRHQSCRGARASWHALKALGGQPQLVQPDVASRLDWMTPHRPPLKAEVGVRELHDQLSRYVQHAASGGEVIVTMRGRRVARLAPVAPDEALEELRARGLVREPQREWQPRRTGRATPTEPVSDLVAEQRR